MSGIGKAFKKIWRPIEKFHTKLTNVSTLGLHKKWKKVRHKIVKSKIFKVVVAAVAIYFGGAALLSMAWGGTASAGIGSAWAGAQGATSAVMAGNFSGAASALGTGFTGGSAAGAGAGFAAGQAATQATIAGNAAAASGAAAGGATAATTGATTTAPTSAALQQQMSAGLMEGVSTAGLSNGTLTAGAGSATSGAMGTGGALGTGGGGGATSGGGLLSGAWNSLGDAGKSALITSGINMAGQAIQGKAEGEAAEEERKRRTYWGMDGDGNQAAGVGPNFSLLNPNNFASNDFTPKFEPSHLDDLIAQRKQLLGG
ncbi:hypothetical protein [Rheinheimera sp. MMS21-TC3]|uniref:hypothetical protein n=1 Tax=Rheinheimera sp. MMS21-TC3 TaxID=3072790 RepID=UPI0028C3D517|nr:hypothetical protein [Rheinheimera sp. MMS21-TC3]WNO60452.1 hypothetical protein RDV63_05660 [Rheinheimera sp. MMS21-TC3]